MRIIVLVKQVPEPTATWHFAADHTLDRTGVEAHLSQLDEYAVEQAVRLAENYDGGGDPGTELPSITCLTMGPASAADALRKALAMGAQHAVHVLDDALHGSDAIATSMVLSAAVDRLGYDVVICGMASTDAEMSVLPSMLAERLGAAQATNASAIRLDPDGLHLRRETDTGTEQVVVAMPAVVSVTDQSGEPRYPAFKAIMAARKKTIEVWGLADLGIDPSAVGLSGANTVVEQVTPRPPRTAGTVVVDDGTAAVRLADFLAAGNFV